MATRENSGETRTQERKGVERAESAITQSPTSPSPFLRELDAITGPNSSSGSGARAMEKLDKDGFTGRAEGLEAYKIMSEKSSWLSYQTGHSSLSRADIKDYAQKPNLSAGEKALATRLYDDFNKISSDRQSITSADVKNFIAREQKHGDLRNLYANDPKTGKSLYDSVKDGDGGVFGDKLTKALQDRSLSNQDRSSLDTLDKLRGNGTGDISRGALRIANDTAGLSAQERQNRDSRKRSEPMSADAQAGQTALSDLTVKPNGGRSLLDRVGDGNGGLSMQKIDALASNPERNNLTQRNVETLKYLQTHAPEFGSQDYSRSDLQKLAADSGQSWDRLSSRPERTKLDDVSRSRQEEFAHLFDKKAGVQSLYDRVKTEDGGISTNRINEQLRNPSLNAKDRHSLEYVKSLARDGWTDKKDISKSELVDKAHQHNMGDRELKQRGLDPALPTGIVRPVPRPDFGGSEVPESVHGALKVRAGEGYYHSAERLIAEAHKGQRYDPTQAELSSVAKQLSAANGHRRELKQNEELVIDQTVRSNPALSGLFR